LPCLGRWYGYGWSSNDNVGHVAGRLDIASPTANRLVGRFEDLGLVREITGQRRSRLYRYEPYLALFDDPDPSEDQDLPIEATEG
jgi:DNA-binding MarR family transcriptional regulator